MLVAWPRALYGRIQITQGLIHQVRRAAATQRRRPIRRQKKRGKTVQFDGTAEEVNNMTDHNSPIPRKTKGNKKSKKPKSDKDTDVPEEGEHTYGIDRLNIGDQEVES